jgi:hypothetical protein
VILRLQMMPSTDPTMQFAGSMIPQLTTHMSALQLGTSGSVIIQTDVNLHEKKTRNLQILAIMLEFLLWNLWQKATNFLEMY